MSAALQHEETARERLLENVLDQLEPLYALIYEGDHDIARQAAMDAMDPYIQDERTDLAVAGQIIACGLAAMRVLQLCMRPDINAMELARLTRTADTLSRTEQRHRKTGLYPTPPKPARTPALPTPAPAPPEPTPEPIAEHPQPHPTSISLPSRPGVSRPPAHDLETTASLTMDDLRQIHLTDGASLNGLMFGGDGRSLRDRALTSSSLTPPRT